MLLKGSAIPLCDLRLKTNENNKLRIPPFSCGKESSDTGIKYASDEENERKKDEPEKKRDYLSAEDEEDVENYEVKKVKTVKRIVKILSSSSEKEDENVSRSQREERSRQRRQQKKRSVQKILYKFKFKKGKQDDESSSEDDSLEDPDFNIKEETKKEKKTFEKSVPDFNPRYNQKKKLNAYEEMIQRNREEKMAFLQSIKIAEAKAGLVELVEKTAKKKSQPVKRKYHTAEKSPTSPPVLRKSRRLANINIDFSEDSLYANALKLAQTPEPKKIIPSEMTFKEALQSDNLYNNYSADISVQESKSGAKFFSYDKSVLSKMTIKESNIAKVTPGRITALSWYSVPDQLIVAAGDKYGQLGVWNVDSESNPYVFKIHLEGITNVKFSPYHREQIVSSSYDGILRCGDMIQHHFNELYNVSDETSCTYFDFLSASAYLIAQRNGQVALVDKRIVGKNCEKRHTCHDYSIKTVNIHPTNKNYFVTAENKGAIRLWDLRKLQNKPVADITYHRRCVHSAFFSPITGNSILTTSADDSVCIFDSTDLTSDVKVKVQMRHNNQTGRWLSVFRATWLPNSEDAFVVGSMAHPRKIEVFDKNMFLYKDIQDDNFTSITSTNVFHPMRPALAGGNSSGKVFVFT